MIDVFMEREWPSPLTEPGFWQEAEGGLDCMPLYNVKWLESYLAVDGSRLVCHFHSPDLESIRTYLRQTDTAYVAVWRLPWTLSRQWKMPGRNASRCAK
jgi:hypothetical protein